MVIHADDRDVIRNAHTGLTEDSHHVRGDFIRGAYDALRKIFTRKQHFSSSTARIRGEGNLDVPDGQTRLGHRLFIADATPICGHPGSSVVIEESNIRDGSEPKITQVVRGFLANGDVVDPNAGYPRNDGSRNNCRNGKMLELLHTDVSGRGDKDIHTVAVREGIRV